MKSAVKIRSNFGAKILQLVILMDPHAANKKEESVALIISNVPCTMNHAVRVI